MNITKAYKYRIYPTSEQKGLLAKTFGCVRLLWNHNVAHFNAPKEEKPVLLTSTQLRHENEFMLEVSAAAIQQKEMDFKATKKQFFNKTRKSKINKPKFKNKFDNQSYRLPNQKFCLLEHQIRLEKIGYVKLKKDRSPRLDCKFISVTISKDKTNKYYVSVCVQEEQPQRFTPTDRSVGIDLGLKDFICTSDGEVISNPKYFHESQVKLKKLQQNQSRKNLGSVRRKKAKTKVARLHKQISNQRNWFLHQVALDLIKNYDIIGIENLSVQQMQQDQKLAKSIADASWSRFVQILKYKAEWNNKLIIQVDRYYPSSKTCSCCGFINKELKLEDREWTCPDCSILHDRDINAAINIANESYNLHENSFTDSGISAVAQAIACA